MVEEYISNSKIADHIIGAFVGLVIFILGNFVGSWTANETIDDLRGDLSELKLVVQENTKSLNQLSRSMVALETSSEIQNALRLKEMP